MEFQEAPLSSLASRESRVVLHELVVRAEDEDFIVGRLANAQFVALPPEGVRAIELLREGASIAEVEVILLDESRVEIDVLEFVVSLVDLGFVAAVDDSALSTNEETVALPWLRANHLRWIEYRTTLLVYLGLLSVGVFALAMNPGLVPKYHDFFWSSSPGLVIVGNTTLFIGYLAFHEFAHLVAARSLGVPGRLTFGTRLHNLVIQTDVTGLWSVPRGRRYRVYTAGMAWDLVPLSASLAVLSFATPAPDVQAALRALNLVICLSLAQQFQFFMRTDLYFVLLDLTRSRNLFEDATVYLAVCGRRLRLALLGRRTTSDPFAGLSKRRRTLVKTYACFILVGSAAALAIFAVVTLPIAVVLFVRASHTLTTGLATGDAVKTLDGAGTLIVEGGLQLAFLLVFVRSRGEWLSSLRHRLRQHA